MKNKKVIISIILTSIVLISLVVISATQAYFNQDVYANNPTEYQSGLLSIEAVSKSNNISLDNTLPMSDDDGIKTTPYVFTIKNNGNVDYKFNVKLLSTSENTFSPEYIKLKVDDDEVTTLSLLTDSIIKQDVILPAGKTIDISIRVWLSSDTKNTEIGKTFNSKIVIDGQSVYNSTNIDTVTPITDFTYFLGSDTPTVDTINYYIDALDDYYDVPIEPITLQSNEVLLTKYNGTSKNVVVPDTYTVGDTTYNVVVLSTVYIGYEYEDGAALYESDDGIFMNNTNIESVFLGNNVKSLSDNEENTISYLFYNCTNLINVLKIPSSVTSMNSTFSGCTSLVNAPEIPSSVTSMNSTFSGCTSLVNAPEIPSSVTNMSYTFYECTSLVNAPEIPNSVTNMNYTFNGCTSLVNAPEIPSSVTYMYSTFGNCTNLTGIVKINSSKVSNATYIFANTTKSITVQVPSGSTTYTKINALTTTNGKPSNVTLTTY